MRIVKTAAAASLAAAGLLAGGALALAQPAGDVGASGGATYSARTWHEVNVRICPSTACLPAAGGPVFADRTVGVYCWVLGESITDYGYTNDVWLNIGRQDGGSQWSSALYFVGDEYANLPVTAECADAPKPPTTTKPIPSTTTTPGPTTTTRPSTPVPSGTYPTSSVPTTTTYPGTTAPTTTTTRA
jgi:hypothetical protein